MGHTNTKAAVIGCGSIGGRYAEWLQQLDCQVAIFDVDPVRARSVAERTGARTFDSTAALFRTGVSKVVVATPPHVHLDGLIAALEAGADVLIEKPLAASQKQGDLILAKSTQSDGRVFGVCNMRFHPGPQALMRELGRIGRPLFARLHFGHRLSQMRPAGLGTYAGNPAEGGGIILDCIHEIDYLQWLLGPIADVRTLQAQIGEDQIQSSDVADIQLKLTSGALASIHLDYFSRFKRRGAEIVGTDGTLYWESNGRNPEVCEIHFGDQTSRTTLEEYASLPAAEPYLEMLRRFLGDGAGLQTVQEAHSVLNVGLRATCSGWS